VTSFNPGRTLVRYSSLLIVSRPPKKETYNANARSNSLPISRLLNTPQDNTNSLKSTEPSPFLSNKRNKLLEQHKRLQRNMKKCSIILDIFLICAVDICDLPKKFIELLFVHSARWTFFFKFLKRNNIIFIIGEYCENILLLTS